MKTLIFLDDERNFEDVKWIKYPEFDEIIVVRSYDEFKFAIDNYFNTSYTISFDHDLADISLFGEKTGKDCANYLIEYFIEHNLDPNELRWIVHSQNQIGKHNIEQLILNYVDFYNGELK